MRSQKFSLQRQFGVTLIVSLVILAVVTMLGIASIRNSNLELRMAASARDRAVAFQRAEAALVQVEGFLSSSPSPFNMNSYMPGCAGPNCFNRDCNNGLCFAGDFEGALSKQQCRLAPFGNTATQHWQDDEVWSTEGRHRTIAVATTSEAAEADDVRFIIEFMCFVPREGKIISSDSQEGETDVPLYRVTVQATGEAARSTVMLQSTFRAAE